MSSKGAIATMTELDLTPLRYRYIWVAFLWRQAVVGVAFGAPTKIIFYLLASDRSASLHTILDLLVALVAIYFGLRWTLRAKINGFRIALIAEDETPTEVAPKTNL